MHAHFPGLSGSFSTHRAYLLASHTACQVSLKQGEGQVKFISLLKK